MKYFFLLSFSLLFFPVRAEDISLPEDGLLDPSLTGDEPPEEIILRSRDQPEQKEALLTGIASGFEQREKYPDMIRILKKIYDIPGLSNARKAASASRLSRLASNYATRKNPGCPVEKLKQASDDAALAAFRFGDLAYKEAGPGGKFDAALALLGYAANVNSPDSVARGVRCANEILTSRQLSAQEKTRLLNFAIQLCERSAAAGRSEPDMIRFLEQKLEFIRIPEGRARIRLEIAQKQFFTLRDLAAARKTLQILSSEDFHDAKLLRRIQVFADYLADSD